VIIGSTKSLLGSGAISLSANEWNDISNTLGPSGTYFWTVGSANDGGKTLFANWQAINDPKARLLTPTDGSTLPSAATTFTWNAGTGVQNYALWVGSEPGSYDLYAGNEGKNLSKTINMPTDGRPLYVRLWSMLNGAWEQYFSYSFTAQKASGAKVKAQMMSPVNEAILTSGNVTFTWDAGAGAQQYALWVGSSPGASDLYAGGEALRTSKTLTLPTDGRTIYVRLWTMLNGTWQSFNAYSYTTEYIPTEEASILTPSDNSTLTSAATTFSWNTGAKVERYALWIGSTPGGYDLYGGDEGTNLSKTVTLPTDGRPIYVQLWSRFGGKWERFTTSTFTTQRASGSNVKAQILTLRWTPEFGPVVKL